MEQMHQLADAVRETFSADGHNIKKAVSLHPSFGRSKVPQSGLARNMVLDAIAEQARVLNIGVKTVAGGGCDILVFEDLAERHYRVLKATKDPETDAYDILGSENLLEVADAEPSMFATTERWVFAYTVDDAGMIVDIFEARVAGLSKHKVQHLLLEDITILGTGLTTPPGGRGYQPPDEDLDGFGEEESGEDGSETM